MKRIIKATIKNWDNICDVAWNVFQVFCWIFLILAVIDIYYLFYAPEQTITTTATEIAVYYNK